MKSAGGDWDGLSLDLRHVQEESCAKFLGLGLYNVTIITTPTWLFVYEIDEGLQDYVRSLGQLMRFCRRRYPTLMENHVVLIQNPTAVDIFPNDTKYVSEEWRQNHNFREEAVTEAIYRELYDEVDGIIPAFELTLAKNWLHSTCDGVHLDRNAYIKLFHVQVSAIISAMKFRKGWSVPLISQDDINRTHWFYDVPMERKVIS